MPTKLLVVSSRARKANAAVGSLLPGVTLIRYRSVSCIKIFMSCVNHLVTFGSYESTSVEDLFQLVLEEVQHQTTKIENLAFLLSGSEKVNFLIRF